MNHWTVALATLYLCFASPAQDPVEPKKDNIYVEFLTDCNWLVWGLKGKIKLKADNTYPGTGATVGFRSWEPNFQLGTQEFRGMVIYTDLQYAWARDYLIFNNSAYIATFPDRFMFPFIPGWNYGIHYNELGGNGYPNAGAIMRVWGPAQFVRLYHGEAMVKHGDTTEYIKVDEDDYLNYPPWQVELR